MKLFLVRFIILLSIMSSAEVLSEEITCPLGRSCELNLQDKIKRSLSEAALVVSGSFNAVEASPVLESLADDLSFMYAEFNIDKTLKGDLELKQFTIKLPIYTAPSKKYSNKIIEGTRPKDLLLQDMQQLERDLENGKIDKANYRNELEKLRSQVLFILAETGDKSVIVPIKRGGLDVQYRLIDVPVRFGNQYVLFIFRDINKLSATPLFPWELDLYPSNELSLIETIANK